MVITSAVCVCLCEWCLGHCNYHPSFNEMIRSSPACSRKKIIGHMRPGSRGWNNILFHHLKNGQTIAVGYLVCYLGLCTGRMNERLKVHTRSLLCKLSLIM